MERVVLGLCILLLFSCGGGSKETTRKGRFTYIPASQSGVTFSNTLSNSEYFNIIEYLYFYNGGGVSAGDINNDGLPDLYFSSNQWQNKLYLNKGNFKFEDITEKAGVFSTGNWKTGVSMADVNGDGFLDIYVCTVSNYKSFAGRNQLFINNGDLTFTEKAEEYGLAFQGFSTQSAFFDFDNDGDLDMYLLNHSVHSVRSYGDVSLRNQKDSLAGDRLYRNDMIPGGDNRFTDVTAQAGIFTSQIGYGLGVGISDLDNNGFADIYVSNDFHENDYMYLNNGDGTFRQELEKSMAHTSRFSMGNDIADINEDGWNDIVTLDMFPRDEKAIKTTSVEDNYEIQQFKLRFGYHYQVLRNAMQMNLGVNDGTLLFSDVAPLAGVAATDWSWAPLLADFDNDGSKDMFITNGIVGRPNDMDFISYISNDSLQKNLSDEQLFSKMPSGKVANFFFRKSDGLKFEDVSESWIGKETSFSNGAAYADLDNDGDLDLAVNNINEPAFIMRNELEHDSVNYIKLSLEGSSKNRFGIGAAVKIYSGYADSYFREQFPSRGWLSSVDYTIHVGLGENKKIDSLIVIWPGGKFQKLTDVNANQTLKLKESDASGKWNYSLKNDGGLLKHSNAIAYKHMENDFNVLEFQRLIPHANSTKGPKMSVGDINGDKLDDLFIAGGQKQAGSVYVQTRAGKFVLIPQPAFEPDIRCEETCSALFDIDGDKDLDLLIGSGGEEFLDKRTLLRLYTNNGRGAFTRSETGLQKIYVNASVIAPADVDNDGDLDVFVGGGTVTGKYGIDSDSFILLNDGKGTFTESPKVFDRNQRPGGMIQAALWTELNGDLFPDLVTAGEWMSVSAWLNDAGVLKKQVDNGMDSTFGWWSSLAADDMDGDGDTDIIAGNFGLNTRLQISDNEPVELIISDLDMNGSLDQILSYYNNGRRYPLPSRDQLVKQIPSMKKRFLKYSDYANTLSDKLAPGKRAFERRATMMATTYFENQGGGKFLGLPLPQEAQLFPVFGIRIADVNADNQKDILLTGNLYAVQPELWRHDAGYGLLLTGNGEGVFTPVAPRESGFVIKGEGRDIQTLLTANKEQLFLVTRNNDSLLIFKRK